MKFLLAVATTAAIALLANPAQAEDDGAELWLNPAVALALDDTTGLELETAQRFRSNADGRDDTFFFRLWLNHDVSDAATLSGAVERRINHGGSNEARLIQQLSTRHGIFRNRLRLEQRFVDNAGRIGLRLRPRIGVAMPIGETGFDFKSDAELMFTLRSTRPGGDDGLTGVRTQIGVTRDVSDNLALGLTYLRQQDINPGEPDTVGHAPLVAVEFSF